MLLAATLIASMVGVTREACFSLQVKPIHLPTDSISARPSDLATMLGAAERIHLTGKAQLEVGRYPVAGSTGPISRLSLERDTTLNYEVLVALDEPAAAPHGVTLSPRVLSFSLKASSPIEAESRSGLTVSISEAELSTSQNDQLTLEVALGRTFAKSIVNVTLAALSVPHRPVKPLDGLLTSLSISELELALRASAKIEYLDSTLTLADNSSIKLTNVAMDAGDQSAAGAAAINLSFDSGTCLVSKGARACPASGSLAFDTQFSVSPLDGWSFTLPENHGEVGLQLEGGAVTLGGGTALSIREFSTSFSQLHCAAAPGKATACTSDATVSARLGQGTLLAANHGLQFSDLTLGAARVHSTGNDLSISISHLVAEDASLCIACDSDAGTRLQLSTLEIPTLNAKRWDEAEFVDSRLQVGAGELAVTAPNSHLVGRLQAGAKLRLSKEEFVTLGTATTAHDLNELHLQAELKDLALVHDGTLQLSTEKLTIDASATASEFQAELRSSPNVTVSGGSTGQMRISNTECSFDSIGVVATRDSIRVSTHGLSILSPKSDVLELIRPAIPPAFVGDQEPFDSSLGKTLIRLGHPLDLGRLSNFRSTFEASGLDDLHLSLENGGLRARGDARGTFKVVASKKHIRTDTCRRRATIKIPYPCFYHWRLKTCHKDGWTWAYYPCIKTSRSDEKVFSASVKAAIDLTGMVTTNAPVELGALQLTGRISKCERVDLHGVADTLEDLLKTKEKLCERLTSISTTFDLGKKLGLENNRLAESIYVRDVELDSDATHVILQLDLDATL